MITLFPSRTVAIELFGFAIHWYGLLYLFAFLIAFWMVPLLQKERGLSLSKDEWASIASYSILGVIVGGRLGYMIFYAPDVFLSDPLETLRVWNGGMASHGGFIGVAIALWLSVRKKSVSLLALTDVILIPVALGLALGRVGNLINLELYGTVTSLPWGMEFPGAEGFRHPTQIYAIVKNLMIAAVCYWHLRFVRPIIAGQTSAIFLILYALLRFTVEIFRDQPFGYTQVLGISLSRGQLLTLPVLCFGIVLFFFARRQRLR